MAVVSVPNYSRIILNLQTGIDANGKPLKVSKSYNYVKAEAVDQDVFDVANSLAGLQNKPVLSVERLDREQLM